MPDPDTLPGDNTAALLASILEELKAIKERVGEQQHPTQSNQVQNQTYTPNDLSSSLTLERSVSPPHPFSVPQLTHPRQPQQP